MKIRLLINRGHVLLLLQEVALTTFNALIWTGYLANAQLHINLPRCLSAQVRSGLAFIQGEKLRRSK